MYALTLMRLCIVAGGARWLEVWNLGSLAIYRLGRKPAPEQILGAMPGCAGLNP